MFRCFTGFSLLRLNQNHRVVHKCRSHVSSVEHRTHCPMPVLSVWFTTAKSTSIQKIRHFFYLSNFITSNEFPPLFFTTFPLSLRQCGRPLLICARKHHSQIEYMKDEGTHKNRCIYQMLFLCSATKSIRSVFACVCLHKMLFVATVSRHRYRMCVFGSDNQTIHTV